MKKDRTWLMGLLIAVVALGAILTFVKVNISPEEKIQIDAANSYKVAKQLFEFNDFQSAKVLLNDIIEGEPSIYTDSAKDMLVDIYDLTKSHTSADDIKLESSFKPTSKKPSKTKGTRFVLTHFMGRSLPTNADFFIDGSTLKLDYNNGESITYSVLSGDKYNPMCGINTVDHFGDRCEICVTKRDGNGALVQFEYDAGTLSFEGYYVN